MSDKDTPKEKDQIEMEQVSDLIQVETHKNKFFVFVALWLAFSGFIFIHSLYSIYSFSVDKSIPLVVCPRSFDLDAPVLMNTISETKSTLAQDRWIRGFARRYILNAYPRTPDDAERFYEFVMNRSRGDVYTKYQAYMGDIDEIKTRIRSGYNIKFYPKDSSDMKIRRGDGENRWVVEVDGYMVKNLGGKQERSTPRLRFVVESDLPTRYNPDGLYVIESNVEQVQDYVSGRKQ